jgi:SAM-dependent MidA family methyltransferase
VLGRPQLVEIIRCEIEAAGGSIPFVRFQELALYQPDHGYYAQVERTPGRRGDFMTSVSIGPLFGAMLGRQFRQMWGLMDKPAPCHLIEQGAMDGQLAVDVLQYLRDRDPDFFEASRYLVIEPFPANQKRQRETLQKAGLLSKVDWEPTVESLKKKPHAAIFFSNELIDSFPVHRVAYTPDGWREFHVTSQNDKFIFTLKEIAEPLLIAVLEDAPREIDFEVEISLRSREWIRSVAAVLSSGFVMTIDYGWPRHLYYSPERWKGTLRCYHKHRQDADPLTQVGEKDITADVDFTALHEAGSAAGLDLIGYTDQHHFLTGLAAADMAQNQFLQDADSSALAAWKTLTHPEMMGSRFDYLLQSKGISPLPELDGLRFARAGGLTA